MHGTYVFVYGVNACACIEQNFQHGDIACLHGHSNWLLSLHSFVHLNSNLEVRRDAQVILTLFVGFKSAPCSIKNLTVGSTVVPPPIMAQMSTLRPYM
jgi:hypothetical protein